MLNVIKKLRYVFSPKPHWNLQVMLVDIGFFLKHFLLDFIHNIVEYATWRSSITYMQINSEKFFHECHYKCSYDLNWIRYSSKTIVTIYPFDHLSRFRLFQEDFSSNLHGFFRESRNFFGISLVISQSFIPEVAQQIREKNSFWILRQLMPTLVNELLGDASNNFIRIVSLI